MESIIGEQTQNSMVTSTEVEISIEGNLETTEETRLELNKESTKIIEEAAKQDETKTEDINNGITEETENKSNAEEKPNIQKEDKEQSKEVEVEKTEPENITESPKESKNVSEYPGPILNEDIILLESFYDDPEDTQGFTKYPLKYGLSENLDFILVPDDLWDLWQETYGGLDIPRRVRLIPDFDKPIVEVYLQRVPLYFVPRFSAFPQDIVYLYISKSEPASNIIKKVKAICSKCIIERKVEGTIDNLKFRIWKIHEEDLEDFMQITWDIFKRTNEIQVSGELIDESKIIEDLCISETNVILAELALINKEFLFKRLSVIHPRVDLTLEENGEMNWGEHVTLEENKFMNIPLERLFNLKTMRCGRTGLENFGNTCYMNSGLQCLSNTQELTKYFILGLYKKDINKFNPLGQKGYFAEAYAELIDEMWRGNSRSTDARILKKRIVINAKQFHGYAQHDSQELIISILDGLHEDLNRVKTRPYIEVKDYENMSDNELSKLRWNEYLERDKSVITDLFVGQLRSKLVCPLCNEKSTVFDPFMMLSVPIPQPSAIIVNFIPSNFKHSVERLRLAVNDATLISDINKILITVFKVPSTDSIHYAIVVKGRIHKHLGLSSTCSLAMNKGELYAYQISTPANPSECYYLEVDFKYITTGLIGQNVNSLDFPLVFAVPLDSTVTEVKIQILDRLMTSSKQSNDVLSDEQLKGFYCRYFTSNFDSAGAPYTLSIVNNRTKSSRLLVFSKYDDCEFCNNKGHSENCPFQFSNENEAKMSHLLKAINNKRKFILELKLNPKLQLLDLKRIVSFLKLGNTIKTIENQGQQKARITLYDCLESFSKEERLDEDNMWYCSKCKTHVTASKKMDLFKLPEILIIHLKRFRNKVLSIWSSPRKITDFVDYPIRGLDLKRHTLAPEDISGGYLYDLFAVSNHFGGLSGGHYTAACFNPLVNAWICFDDSSVNKAGTNDVVSSSGYVLFYRRVKAQ